MKPDERIDFENTTPCTLKFKRVTLDDCMECIYCLPKGNIVASLSDVRCGYDFDRLDELNP